VKVKRLLFWAISLGLSGGLLYLFLRNARLSMVVQEAREASVPLLLVAVLLEVVSVFLRVYRWRVMLASVKERIPFLPMLKAMVVSFAMSGLIPGRVGEVAKPYLLSRWEKLPFTPLMASVVLERGMDLVSLVILWFCFLLFGTQGVAPEAEEAMAIFTHISYFLLAVAIPAGIFLLWLVPRRRVLDRGVRRSERLQRHPMLMKALRLALKLAEGLGTFHRKRTILYVTFLSLVIWLCIAGSCWALVEALHLGLPLGASILLLMFISFGAAIPTPGGVGSVHKAIQISLVLFYSVPEDMGVTAGILGHAIMFFPGILWGLGYILLGRVHLWELKEVAKAKEEEATPGGEAGPGPEA
jgi:uncharacterized protein (TIRG00374 family)